MLFRSDLTNECGDAIFRFILPWRGVLLNSFDDVMDLLDRLFTREDIISQTRFHAALGLYVFVLDVSCKSSHGVFSLDSEAITLLRSGTPDDLISRLDKTTDISVSSRSG